MNLQHLVFSALGKDRPGIVEHLSRVILDCHGNIHESQMSILGGEFALMLLISGNEQTINTLQQRLPELEQQLELTIVTKQTNQTGDQEQKLVHVHVEAMDHPGIVHRVTEFFALKQFNIKSLETNTYPVAHTGTPMFSLEMELLAPCSNNTVSLQHEFEDFCEQLGLDGELADT